MSDVSAGLDRRRLFIIGNLAIFMIGLGFAVRANIAADIQVELFDPLDLARSASMVGEVVGATFTGFALTLLLGSAILDLVGMKRMLAFAAFGFVAGSVTVLFASLMEPQPLTYWLILIGFLLTGFGWGAVEAGTNPMVAAMKAVNPPMRATTVMVWAACSKTGKNRPTRNTPAATMVAAWIKALTGVGPSIASGSQV